MEKKKVSARSSSADHSAKKKEQIEEGKTGKKKSNQPTPLLPGPSETGSAPDEAMHQRQATGRETVFTGAPASGDLPEHYYREIFNSTNEAIYVAEHTTGRILDVNDALVRLYGFESRDEALGKTINDLFMDQPPLKNQAALDDYVRRVFSQGPQIFEWQARKKSGEKCWIEVSMKRLQFGDTPLLLAVVRDIESRKRIEEEVKIHRDRLLRAEQVSRSGNWEFHLDSGTVYASEGARAIYGVLSEWSIREAQKVPLPEYRALLDTALADLVEGRSDYNVEFKIRHLQSGEIRDIRSVALYDKETQVVFGIIQDITENKRAEHALRESEEQFRILFETIEQGILYQHANGRITTANPAAERILGLSVDELRERTSLDPRWRAIHEDGSPFPGDKHPSIVALRTGQSVLGQIMGIFHPKENAHRWLLVSAYPLFKPDETLPYQAVASFTDITAMRAANESLKQRENLLNKILDLLPVGLWLADKDGQLIRSNKEGRDIWGAEPLVGSDQYSIFKAYRLPSGKEIRPDDWALAHAIREKATITDELLEIHAFDGKKKIVLNYAAPVLNERGDLEAAIVVNQDITSRMQTEIALRDSEEKFRSMAEQMYDVLFVTDHTGTITYISPAAQATFGYTPHEMIGNHFAFYLAPSEAQKAGVVFAQSVVGEIEAAHLELTMQRKDQTSFVGELVAKRVNAKAMSGTIGVIRDVSERKRLQDDLVAAKERAEESDRLKTAFLQNISHEIRTPMNGILGFSDMLTDPDLTPEKRKYFIEIIRHSGEHLLSIIDDIINVAVLEAGKINLIETDIDLYQLLRIVHDEFSLKATEKQLQFEKQIAMPYEEAQIRADETKLKQIITNLLVNAFRFTHKGRVTMCCRRDNGFLEFRVSDTGIGIDPQHHAAIFERFRQLQMPTAVIGGGIGLGLAICKGYIEQMGGRIWLESTPGQGSDFYFTLPYRPVERHDVTVVADPTVAAPKRAATVLVAEDDPVNFQLIQMWLAPLHLNLLHAADGREAVELCRLHPEIRLVIMDMRMPVMDGYEATRVIRQHNGTVPIIALTAYALSGDREKALQVGCSDYLARPAKRGDLLTLIEKYLES